MGHDKAWNMGHDKARNMGYETSRKMESDTSRNMGHDKARNLAHGTARNMQCLHELPYLALWHDSLYIISAVTDDLNARGDPLVSQDGRSIFTGLVYVL